MISITEQPSSTVEIIPFALRLPASVFQGVHEDEPTTTTTRPNMMMMETALLSDTGIVGTITLLKKSVLIWFGWGKLQVTTSSSRGPDESSNGA